MVKNETVKWRTTCETKLVHYAQAACGMCGHVCDVEGDAQDKQSVHRQLRKDTSRHSAEYHALPSSDED